MTALVVFIQTRDCARGREIEIGANNPAQAAGWGLKIGAEHGRSEKQGFGVEKWVDKPSDGRKIVETTSKTQFDTMNKRSNGKLPFKTPMKIAANLFTVLCGMLVAHFARGQTWTLTSANTNLNWSSVASSADGTKLAATASGICLSTNSGAEWTTSSAPVEAWSSIASSADGTRLIAADGSVYLSTNSGATWASLTTPPVGNPLPGNLVASSADGSKLMAAQATGYISISTNSGETWFIGTNLTRAWSDIACSADGSKMAAIVNGDGSQVFVSTNCGLIWHPAPLIIGQPHAVIAWTADASKLIVVTSGFFYVSTNCGMAWCLTNNNAPFGTAIACSANGSTLATVAYNDLFDTSTNFGVSWITNDVPAEDWISFASSADGNELLAASAPIGGTGPRGGIWILQTPPSPQLNDSLSNGSLNISWIVPSTNMVLEQSPDLINWTPLTNTPSLNYANLQEQLAIAPTNGSSYFRLISY